MNLAKTVLGDTMELREQDMNHFCALIEQRAGIHLKPAKHDLVRSRLRSRLQAHKCVSYSDYRKFLGTLSPDHPEWEIFTNLLTTNKTDFFREEKHFDFLTQKILPEWLKGSERTFKVWSSACSTGEEPYTLAMVLSAHLPPDRDFKILATDIDTEVLAFARNAVYPNTKKPEIPSRYQGSCLDGGTKEVRDWFRIKPHLKEKVLFRQHNLIEDSSLSEAVFDLVLCRNVLIYFSAKSIHFVQEKIRKTTKAGGYLFIGHSESFQGISHSWKPTEPSIYLKDK